MKAIGTVLIIVAATVIASSQTGGNDQSPPDVSILSQKWSKNFHRLGWDRAPISAASASTHQTGPPMTVGPTLGPLIKEYLYKAKVKNTGLKVIRLIGWNYLFTDSQTQKEIGRHQFYSVEKISPNKEKTLEGRSTSPPTKVVSAGALEKNARNPYNERIVINCVAYSDGSMWRHPSYTGRCEPERRRRRFYRR